MKCYSNKIMDEMYLSEMEINGTGWLMIYRVNSEWLEVMLWNNKRTRFMITE